MGTIEKTKATKEQLKTLILEPLGFAAFLGIYPDAHGRFRAQVITTPAQAIATQQTVDNIAAELNATYELAD
jgi:hypothetical protein